MIIGEAPGQQEAREHRPFVGHSGKLLRQVLRALGVDPERDAYITNTVICHPKDNETPSPEIWKGCQERLIAEIRDVRPTKILTLGAIPISALIDFVEKAEVPKVVSITKERGIGRMMSLGTEEDPLDVFVVPSFHPAAILRTNTWFPELAADIGKVVTNDQPEPFPKVGTEVVQSVEEALDALDWILTAEVVSCDLETTGTDFIRDRILSIGFGVVDPEDITQGYAVIIPIGIAEDERVKNRIFEALIDDSSSAPRMVFHNAKFDLQFFDMWYGWYIRIPKLEDTMEMHYALDERSRRWGPGHSLKSICRRYDIPDYHFDFEEFYLSADENGEFPAEDLAELYEYHGLDCYITARLFYDLRSDIIDESTKLWELYRNVYIPEVEAFTEIEIHGTLIDKSHFLKIKQELEGEIGELALSLITWAREMGLHIEPIPFDVEDYHEILKAARLSEPDEIETLFKDWGTIREAVWRLKVDPENRSAKQMYSRARNRIYKIAEARGLYFEGKLFNPGASQDIQTFVAKLGLVTKSTERDELWLAMSQQNVSDDVRTKIDVLIDYRGKTKLYSTYVVGLLDVLHDDGRLRPDYNLTGTSTSRISCERPNLMNIPQLVGPIIHTGFIAPEGWVFCNADFSQLELRVAAFYSQDERMIEAYKNGADIHREVAAAMFGKPPEEITYFERYLAKYVDFGVIYGRQAKSLTESWEMEYLVQQGGTRWTEAQAQVFIDQFLNQFQGLKRWIEKQHRFVVQNNYVETPTGFRRRFPFIDRRSQSSIERQAVNTPIQSLASHITLTSLFRIHNRLMEYEDPIAHILFTVHDSIALEIRQDKIHEVMGILWEEMVENAIIETPFPLKIDAEVGMNWGHLEKFDFAEIGR